MDHQGIFSLAPSEILGIIFSDLSNEDILNLPIQIITRGLSASTAKRRFKNVDISLTRTGLEQLYCLSTISYLASTIQELRISMDRITPVTTDDVMNFQWDRHNVLKADDHSDYFHRTLRRPKAINMRKIHRRCLGSKPWSRCRKCNRRSLLAQQNAIVHAATSQRQVEKSKLDEHLLQYAFNRMKSLQRIEIKSSFLIKGNCCVRTELHCFNIGTLQIRLPWDPTTGEEGRRVHSMIIKAMGASQRGPWISGKIIEKGWRITEDALTKEQRSVDEDEVKILSMTTQDTEWRYGWRQFRILDEFEPIGSSSTYGFSMCPKTRLYSRRRGVRFTPFSLGLLGAEEKGVRTRRLAWCKPVLWS